MRSENPRLTRLFQASALIGLFFFPAPSAAASACGTDTWDPLAGSSPFARSGQAAVWTGSEVIVWGGENLEGPLGDGARYNPATGIWTAISTALAPSPRRGHTAVWTGTEMIVWGGEDNLGPLADGARYNPATDTWTPSEGTGAPSARWGHAAVWTGNEMIIWGGEEASGAIGDGARYDPATNQWAPVSSVGAPSPRRKVCAVWTGSLLIIWGGVNGNVPLADGALYNPAADSWIPMNSTGAPAARFGVSAVWAGTEMLVWGGHDGAGPLATGGRYNPQNDSWSAMPGGGAPSPRFGHSVVWTGYEMVVWGGEDGANVFDTGARFIPATDQWTAAAMTGAPLPRTGHSATWTGRQMVIWGGFSGVDYLQNGAAYCGCAQSPSTADSACDGMDEDCDGSVDEDYASETTSCGAGVCARTGQSSCSGGTVQDNCTPGTPEGSDTDCDGTDDDCDGSVDEDFVSYPTDCGLGACRRSGVAICSGGSILINCLPGEPGLEICDGVDNDCDGSLDEDRGTRYIAPLNLGGDDTNNTCLDKAHPCFSITHANTVSCDNETVSVAEGVYLQDVDITHPLTIDAEGVPTLTIINGTGTRDVVRILSSNVRWSGVDVFDTPHVACVHVGDPDHPNLRNVRFENTAIANCAIGVIWDSTGHPGPSGAWNSYLASSTREMVYDGSPDSGTGTLMINGNGKIDFRVGRLAHNQGSGLVIKAPPEGKENREIVFAGELIWDNGNTAAAPGKSGIEIHGATDVRFEGNTFKEHFGGAEAHDARALLLDGVTSGTFYCNRVYNNDDGVVLTGGTTSLPFLQNQFKGHLGTAVKVGAGNGPGLSLGENIFQANAGAVDHSGDGTLAARHNWWGAANGPAGSPGGTGDPVTGVIDVANFIAKTRAPLLVRRPQDSGWDPSPDTCYWSLQPAVNAAAAGDLIVMGVGDYYEHVTVDKALEIEGVNPGSGCSTTVLNGEQSGVPYRPTLRFSGVSGAAVRNLTIRSAGKGVSCGSASGEQFGLDLVNVSNSSFSNLCLKENGVTELRVFGDSDNNLFAFLTVDGMWRGMDGSDACGHRSREGILIDGGPACEGGPGAQASGNQIANSTISNCTRDVALRLAENTEISGNTLKALTAPAWPSEPATGVVVAVSTGTSILDNIIGNTGMGQGVRVEGKRAGACLTEATDSSGTTIAGNQIKQASQGIFLYRAAGDPGAPTGTAIICDAFAGNGMALRLDYVGAPGSSQNTLYHCDLTGNTAGVSNFADESLPGAGNWWGSISGPGGSGPGTGNTIGGAVDFSPWLTSPARDDFDADGFSECNGDCNDTTASIRPGGSEACDGLDNDCDGTVDNNLVPPGTTPKLQVGRNGTAARLTWNAVTPASGYDLNRGLVSMLRNSSGDFSVAVQSCLLSNGTGLTVDDPVAPAPGDAAFYLLRARNCTTLGTFDDLTGHGQVGARDPEVAASPGLCP